MNASPIMMQWDGEAMRPTNGFWLKKSDKAFVIGEKYSLVEHHERSRASHNQFFAYVAEAWMNLPERLAGDFPNPDTLRKWALVKAGYCTMQRLVCSNHQEALHASAVVGAFEEYTVCAVAGNVLTIWKPKSQSVKAMGRADFQASKEACLHIISELIGADITQHSEAA